MRIYPSIDSGLLYIIFISGKVATFPPLEEFEPSVVEFFFPNPVKHPLSGELTLSAKETPREYQLLLRDQWMVAHPYVCMQNEK